MPPPRRRISNHTAKRKRLPWFQGLAIVAIAAVLSALLLEVVFGHTNRAVSAGRRTTVSAAPKPRVKPPAHRRPALPHSTTTQVAPPATTTHSTRARRPARPSYTIRSVAMRMVDPSRTLNTQSGTTSRSFETIVRYPVPTAVGPPVGPFPLIVFGHGFAVSPQPYSRLLDAWTRAGFVVAAPVFPLENANAPGGPNEKDLPNQPRDMSLVISRLTTVSQTGSGLPAGIINPRQVAVTGQSDGGDTALAAAYDPTVRDHRIGAAMILSGAEDPFAAPFTMPPDGPPLLAVQGTADTVNPPDSTYSFYQQAGPPKFLLRLLGAGHQPPYTEPGPELDAVQRTTIAFLNAVFKRQSGPLNHLVAAGGAGAGTALTSGIR